MCLYVCNDDKEHVSLGHGEDNEAALNHLFCGSM